MFNKQDRRSFLKVAAATGALGAVGGEPAQAQTSAVKLGEPHPFSFESLKQEAQRLVKEPYRKPNIPAPEITSKIDYEAWGKITYNTDHALFADTKERFPIEFFHLGKFFQKAVRVYAVDSGLAREIVYDPIYFNMPADSIAHQLPAGAGFAGFRIQESKDGALDWKKNDWVAFLGASYFRAIGALRQYGLSAHFVFPFQFHREHLAVFVKGMIRFGYSQ